MHIYLMRHGTANSGYTAEEPSLSKDGRIEVNNTADYISENEINFDLIVSSPKLRAAQTADIVAKAVNYPIENIVRCNSLKPNSPTADALATLARYSHAQSVLCVGHLPSLPRLAAALVGLASITAFPNAVLYRLELDSLQTGQADFMQLYAPE